MVLERCADVRITDVQMEMHFHNAVGATLAVARNRNAIHSSKNPNAVVGRLTNNRMK